jgi:hypothetical protein
LFHFNPAYDDDDIDRMIAYGRSLADPDALKIVGASEGLIIQV